MSTEQLRIALADHLALVRVVGAAARMGCRLVRVEAEFGSPPSTLLIIEGTDTSRRRLAAYAAKVMSVYEEDL
jgi:hypothetical protein